MLSADLRQRLRTYLEQRAAHHDAEAIALLDSLRQVWAEVSPPPPDSARTRSKIPDQNPDSRPNKNPNKNPDEESTLIPAIVPTRVPEASEDKSEDRGEDREDARSDWTPGAAPPLAEALFQHWRARAEAEVGESFWSYPIPLEDLAQDLGLSATELRSHIARWGRADCQLVDSRDSRSATVAFHPAPKRREVPPSTFQVGDRVRVTTAQRLQYFNCTGVITQTISVSCRVQLDNGWQAFLPYHCLEKLTAES